MKGKTLIALLAIAAAAVGLYFLMEAPGADQTGGNANEEWQKFSGAKYIFAEKWPPVIEARIAQFLCAEPLRQVNGREYCVGSESEGAAGSVYTTYVYNTMQGERMVTATFTLRYPACGNYGEPEKIECERERQTFNLDAIVDRFLYP